MNKPKFTLDDVKYSESEQTFERAMNLWKGGNVGPIQELGIFPNKEHPRSSYGYRAVVRGTHQYHVELSGKKVDQGDCTCYLGQNNQLCKHMLALALKVLDETGSLKSDESSSDLNDVKKLVNNGLSKFKSYEGPSHTWFSYQRGLDIGAGIIIDAVAQLPPSEKNSQYLWGLVLRISNKYANGGIDDSNGTIGHCVSSIVAHLIQYGREKTELAVLLMSFTKDDTGFGFEDELRDGLKNNA